MPTAIASPRSARLGLRATPEQETVLRRAAEDALRMMSVGLRLSTQKRAA